MSSDEVMALATDALRGKLLSVVPSDASVILAVARASVSHYGVKASAQCAAAGSINNIWQNGL